MIYDDIAAFVDECERAYPSEEIRWCDATRFEDEHTDGAAPGGYLKEYGYFVIGTTIGGNAVVVSGSIEGVFFADHTWFGEDEISYQDLPGDREWHYVGYSPENVSRALFQLAPSREEFLRKLAQGEIDRVIDDID